MHKIGNTGEIAIKAEGTKRITKDCFVQFHMNKFENFSKRIQFTQTEVLKSKQISLGKKLSDCCQP